MGRYMHVHVCGGPEPENTNGRKDFIFGPRFEGGGGGQQVFSYLQGGNRKFLKQLGGNRCFFNIPFHFQEPLPSGNK